MIFTRVYIFSVLITIFVCNNLNAQSIPDSLLHKLNTAVNESIKARTMLTIGETIEATFTEKSFDYYQQALALGKKIKNNHLILSSLNDVGVCYIELNKMDSAVIFFEQAISVAKQINDTIKVARIMANIGNVYLHENDRVKAVGYYFQAARLWETAADKNGLAALYSNICSLLNDQKEYNKALEYGNKAVALATKMGDNYSAVNGLLNVSNTYIANWETMKNNIHYCWKRCHWLRREKTSSR